jgi:uncharacterized damage-inducible protein DinB
MTLLFLWENGKRENWRECYPRSQNQGPGAPGFLGEIGIYASYVSLAACQEEIVSELEQALVGDSAFTPPSHILEGLREELAHRVVAGAPRSVYEELWHIAFWQQVTLEWIAGVETPYPERPEGAFPGPVDLEQESWGELCERFFAGLRKAGDAALDAMRLEVEIRCPSRPGQPVRVMTVREQLESLAAHNAYHLGRIVLLRQLLGAWPPPSGGFSW